MTRTGFALGEVIDRAAVTAEIGLRKEREAVLRCEKAARNAGEADLACELAWECAIIDLNVPPQPHYSLFGGSDFESYAKFYGLSAETVGYARQRANETANQRLRVHHLEYALACGPRGDHERVVIRQQLARAYRELIDMSVSQISGEHGGVEGVYVCGCMDRLATLVSASGVLSADEQGEWAHWITQVASRLRRKEWKRDDGISMEHRWPYEILKNLVALRAEAIDEQDRAKALDLLRHAYNHYSRDGVADTFASRVAEVDAAVRRHFREGSPRGRRVRRQLDALIRAAHFHEERGSSLVASSFFREARRLAERQQQYIGAGELSELWRQEREALKAATQRGECKLVRGGAVTINLDDFDRRQDTASGTMESLMALRHRAIPEYAELRAQAARIMGEHPIRFRFGAATASRNKFEREAETAEQQVDRDVQWRTALHAEFVGLEIVVTLVRAAHDGVLTAADVMRALGLLRLDEEEREMLERGIERFLEGDYISAGHILSAQFENAFRRKLAEMGVEHTKVRTLRNGLTRTDEASLGELMYSSTPDGRTVRELIGEDAWEFIDRTMVTVSGWNLRDKFAQGRAGRRECAPAVVGVILHHILWLARLKVASGAEGGGEECAAVGAGTKAGSDTPAAVQPGAPEI